MTTDDETAACVQEVDEVPPLRREHDPTRALLRCSRDDLRAVHDGGRATGLTPSPQLLVVAATLRRPVCRFAVLGDAGVLDGYVGSQLTVVVPAAAADEVVDVRIAPTTSVARQLHRALGELPVVPAVDQGGEVVTGDWSSALDEVGDDPVVQLRWSDDQRIPTAAALVLAVGSTRVRRVTREGESVVVRTVSPRSVWRDCCVLAGRARRLLLADERGVGPERSGPS